jgi:predicted transposase/invertase (TIGR01784 family)
MQLRIDPRVDFACKLMLGSPDHPTVTIHFLNSLLPLEAPIVGIEILNPLVGKDRSEDKVIVLDILARDSLGRLFNIEMQTRIPLSFPNRLLLYNCKNYVRQIGGSNWKQQRGQVQFVNWTCPLFPSRNSLRPWRLIAIPN